MRDSSRNCDTAFILAGGRSSRMSFDKQTITVGGRLIAEYIADLLSLEFSRVFIISNRKSLYQTRSYEVISDEIVGCGPLSGLYTALRNTTSDYAYLTGCDMPYVNLEYIRYMKEKLYEQEKPADGILTTTNGFAEPLNAIYHKRLADLIPPLLKDGKLRMVALYEGNEMIYIPEHIMAGFDPGYEMFFNLNTPDDFSRITNHASFSSGNLCSRSVSKSRDK